MATPSTSIETVRCIFIEASSDSQSVWAEMPMTVYQRLHPQPVLRKAAYVSALGEFERNFESARKCLLDIRQPLLAFLESSTGTFTSRVFVFIQDYVAHLEAGYINRPGRRYWSHEVTIDQPWTKDLKSGSLGYFVTGTPEAPVLWRIERIEADAFNQALITIRPARLLGDLPVLKLDSIPSKVTREEIAGHFHELQRAVLDQNVRAMVTHTRSVAESVVSHLVQSITNKKGTGLKACLDIVQQLRSKSKGELPSFPDLLFHEAHKIRLVHARTHVDRAEQAGRRIEPGMALSCVEDLKEILIEAGLVHTA